MRGAVPFFLVCCAGAIALPACGGSAPSSSSGPDTHGNPAPPHTTVAGADAGTAPTGEPTNVHDSGAPDAPEDASAQADSGQTAYEGGSTFIGFPCGAQSCDPTSEYCIGDALNLQCVRIPKGCSVTTACSCIELNIGGQKWNCTDDNGAVKVAPP
jgi:hypothetical protein